jgi:membrane protease YdiL (CAAX protease family)
MPHERRAHDGRPWRSDAPGQETERDSVGPDDGGLRPSSEPPRFRVASFAGRIAVGYAMLASLAIALALALREGVPWEIGDPWIRLERPAALGVSAAFGLAFGLFTVAGTRFTVKRYAWAKRLHLDLRPIAHGLGFGPIVLVACFSSLGEELLFRGLLQPWLGLLPTAVVFGIVHYMPGEARWVWVTWATAVGLAFGAIFQATGSLLGAVVAHALINAVNLTYLRDHDPMARLAGAGR